VIAMAENETGSSKLAERVSEQQKREHIAADERKRHAARTTEQLKERYGAEDE
jgi:hypothetical protein